MGRGGTVGVGELAVCGDWWCLVCLCADDSGGCVTVLPSSCGVGARQYGKRLKKFAGHTSCVNACSPLRRGPSLVASGGDDGSVKVWDVRSKRCALSLPGRYPVTAVCFGGDGSRIYSGGVDNDITVWDVRKVRSLCVIVRARTCSCVIMCVG